MLGSAALTPLTQPRRACGGKREEGRPGSQGGCVEGECARAAAYGRPLARRAPPCTRPGRSRSRARCQTLRPPPCRCWRGRSGRQTCCPAARRPRKVEGRTNVLARLPCENASPPIERARTGVFAFKQAARERGRARVRAHVVSRSVVVATPCRRRLPAVALAVKLETRIHGQTCARPGAVLRVPVKPPGPRQRVRAGAQSSECVLALANARHKQPRGSKQKRVPQCKHTTAQPAHGQSHHWPSVPVD